ATVFLDTDLNIKRFTPQMKNVVNLIPSDIGRSIKDLVSKLEYGALSEDAEEVLRTLVAKEVEVKTKSGTWYSMRIVPYRTVENVIEGLIITFIGIDKLKQVESQMFGMRDIAQNVLDCIENPALIVDDSFRAVVSNGSFLKKFSISAEDALNTPL